MIDIRNVEFRYASAVEPSLRGFDLAVAPGEFVVLCGRSGCGKTTATRLVNGLAPRFFEGELAGEVRLDGRDTAALSADEIVARVGSVFQDPRSQFFTTDATSEVAFTCENLGMPREELLDRVARTACELDVAGLLDRSIFGLSSGEKQRVALASARAFRPRLYVLDEPSANLDPEAAAQLARLLGRLKEQGATVLVSEHRLSYLRDLADRVVVMEQGRVSLELSGDELRSLGNEDAARLGLRSVYPERAAAAGGRKGRVEDGSAGDGGDAPLIEAAGVAFSYRRGAPVLRGVDFAARAGEVVAIVGRNGAGKSTLASVLCGLRKPGAGTVRVGGAARSARKLRALSSFVMQDADYQLFAESVADELRLGAEDVADADARAAEALERLGLAGLGQRHPASLSGGQKQRVTIGAALVRGSQLVFFDEPTSGLDGQSMRRVAATVRDLASGGRAVFVVTHDFELACACCTRVLHVEDGRIACDLPVSDENLPRMRSLFGMEARAGQGAGAVPGGCRAG